MVRMTRMARMTRWLAHWQYPYLYLYNIASKLKSGRKQFTSSAKIEFFNKNAFLHFIPNQSY